MLGERGWIKTAAFLAIHVKPRPLQYLLGHMHEHKQKAGCRFWMVGGHQFSSTPEWFPLFLHPLPTVLFRLWRRRSRRRNASVSPSRTRLQSRPAGGPAHPGQTGHLRRSPRAPHPQQLAPRTSLPPPVPHLHLRHRHRSRSRNRNRLQTHQQSTGSLRTTALLAENQSHHPEVGGVRQWFTLFSKS